MAVQEFQCAVSNFEMITPTVFKLSFMPKTEFIFKAGQFLSIVIPSAGPSGKDIRRAYSIASTPEMVPMHISIKIVEGGPGTRYLSALRPGDTFRCFGAYKN